MGILAKMNFPMFAGAVIMILGWLMLTLRAFSTSIAWGFGSLVFPPASLGFGVAHFQRGKLGLLICFIGIMVLAVGFHLNKPGAAPATDVGAIEESTTTQPDSAEDPDAVPKPEDLVKPDPAPSKEPRPFLLAEAPRYLHETIRITANDNTTRTGTLLEAHADKIVVEIKVKGTGGTVRTEIPVTEVRMLEHLPLGQ